VSSITPAASVLLSRGPGSRDVYSILRSQHLKFFGGFWAFPGGKLASQDGLDLRLTACRELFEETGVLIARRADGSFAAQDPELSRCRQALLLEQLAFNQILADRGLSVHPGDFQTVGEVTTPAFSPLRFATTFFASRLPAGQEPDVWDGELERGEWITGPGLLARWRCGASLVTPPSLLILETLDNLPVDEAPRLLGPIFARLAGGAMHPIFFAPCVQILPLKTVALPPSSYTNAVLLGNGPRYLIDPGADEPQEQERLFEVLDEHQRAGAPLTAVVLTHHHPDHVGAAAVCARRYGVPIWAHPITAEKLAGRITIDRHLLDGDMLDLGTSPSDSQPWRLEAVFTPGHASGHLAFFERCYGVLIAGDMVSTMTSIVIGPPDGDLAVYLKSLHRLREIPSRMILPAHGNVSTQPTRLLDDALEHRAKRERQLLDELRGGSAGIDELTERMYRGTPEALMRFARAQTLAGLLKLQGEGKARPVGEQWEGC
jgi:glyoxylase-like metal-dependent hydrolase (beta-lactamase superfamily II)/8-oxo-dGTP pyrophosphatase MutT (NUDIX family)